MLALNVLGIAAIGFILFSSAFFYLHIRKKKKLEALVVRAKKELHDVVKISMNNPYPLMQVDRGELRFANIQAFSSFDGLSEKGTNHPAFSDIDTRIGKEAFNFSDEIIIDKKYYRRTVVLSEAEYKNSYIVYFYDITALKNQEREIKQAYDKAENARLVAEEAKQARSDFLANMSHELRTPMNGILGLSDMLREADLDQNHSEMADAVYYSAKNLLAILNDILDFSKIEAGELTIESIAFSPQQALQQIEQLFQPLAIEKDIFLDMNIEEDFPAYIQSDPTRIHQILNNLIGNAIKFTEKGGVTVNVEKHEDPKYGPNIVLKVSDTGIGIAEEKIENIFSKFQQADSSTARKYGGTGLGLTITKQLVDLLGGSLKVESIEGKGSQFEVILPFKNVSKNFEGTDHASAAMVDIIDKNIKILVVDDHPVNLLYVEQALRGFKINNVDKASSGLEAVELCRKQVYDLIFMDCQMPVMDGLEATKQIRGISACENVPIIAVTADAMKAVREECIKCGMNDFVSKPVDRRKIGEILSIWTAGGQVKQTDLPMEQDNDCENHMQVFDWQHLESFCEGDADFKAQIIQMFLTNLTQDYNILEIAYRNNDHNQWKKAGHKLYGACVNMGANRMAHICDKTHIVNNDNKYEIKKVQDKIKEEYVRIKTFLSTNHEFLDNIAS